MALSAKCSTLNFSSGLDLRVMSSSSALLKKKEINKNSNKQSNFIPKRNERKKKKKNRTHGQQKKGNQKIRTEMNEIVKKTIEAISKIKN